MDILLTHGYLLNEDAHERKFMKPYPPLGLLSLSAYLKERGFEAGVYDTTFGSLGEFLALLGRERPAAVGIYGTLMTKFTVLAMTRAAKEAGIPVILGGPEPANYAGEYLSRGADVVVFGEGEAALEELLPALSRSGANALENITGIAFRRGDGSTATATPRPLIGDLDSLPDPDREAVPMDKYLKTWRRHHGAGSVSLICSRGCPYQCTWCSHSVYGHTHRRRSPARVAAEAERIVARYRPERLWYADDVFTIHHPWLFEYAQELKKRGLRIPFECISRSDRLNEAVIDLLAGMGCVRIWLGSESGSQRVLDAMRRGVKAEQVRTTTHALKRRGIRTGMFIMLGYEGEGIEDLEATVDHLKKSSIDDFLTTVAYPIRGTEYYREVQDRIIARGGWESWTDRDLGVGGRHSRRFYSFATRWMVGSVALHRERGAARRPLRIAKSAANVAVGRLGMWATRNECEGAGVLPAAAPTAGQP